MLIAAIGIHGAISFPVARRSREIGVRMAVGEQARQVVLMVVRHGAGLTMIGVTLGIVGGFALAPLAGDQLYGVSFADPVTYAAAGSVLATTGVLATAIPAHRAALVDPDVALRSE